MNNLHCVITYNEFLPSVNTLLISRIKTVIFSNINVVLTDHKSSFVVSLITHRFSSVNSTNLKALGAVQCIIFELTIK